MKFQESEQKLMEVWQRTTCNSTGPNMVGNKLKDSHKGITYSKLVYNLTTVNLEIFGVKIVSSVHPATKIKNTKINRDEGLVRRKYSAFVKQGGGPWKESPPIRTPSLLPSLGAIPSAHIIIRRLWESRLLPIALDLVIYMYIRHEYVGLRQDTVRFRLVVDVHAVLTNSSALRTIEILCVSALSMAYQFFANFRRPYTNA